MADLTRNYRRLASAILRRAVLDAKCTNAKVALPARAWLLADPFAGVLLDGLGISRDVATAWVRGLPDCVINSTKECDG